MFFATLECCQDWKLLGFRENLDLARGCHYKKPNDTPNNGLISKLSKTLLLSPLLSL
jgi:hypothetical protein